MVGVCYAWEVQTAAYGLTQVMPAQKDTDPNQIEASEETKARLWARKVERVKSFREFQAISNIARHNFAIANIDAYKLPLGLIVVEVEDHEKRVTVPNGPGRLKAYVYNKETEVWKAVVPDDVDLVRLHQLTLGLDSGPQGRAAGNFAKHHLKYNVFVRCVDSSKNI